MKFAKAFARQLPPGAAWHDHAIAYTQLKRLVKQCAGLSYHEKLRAETLAQCRAIAGHVPRTDAALQASPAETAFFRALRGEIQKVNRFFLSQQYLCGARVQRLVDDIENETRAIVRHGTRNATGSGHWLQRARRLYQELLALEWFCVLNFCAVSKILKKHDKWTRYDTRVRFEHAVLVRQPFATYVPLLQMMRRVEAIALSVSMAEGWLLPMEPLAGIHSVESRKPALRRRYVSDAEDDTDVTDSEGMRTPRHPAEAFEYDSSSSEVFENHRPRQRQRQE